ncbi:Histone H2A.Z-specific chaperone CHZ1 [Emydomyces testavorans]|uniref:Histone H2A.Z-specific chaperone CHZ1 n=1 Tax=Emydomyces testavorans TaxID=2070801 RepID=A0AAF0IQG7_9EURO|nr:Histone H2A.Z-specific chaperone CHZ1 [Emydomyces testavorans]
MNANEEMSIEMQAETAGRLPGKGKEKAAEAEEVFLGQEGEDTESEESEGGEEDDNDVLVDDDIEEEIEGGDGNLEPISADNIIEGGRRTRGKTINFAEAAAKVEEDDAMDDDEDDDFKPRDEDEEMQG